MNQTEDEQTWLSTHSKSSRFAMTQFGKRLPCQKAWLLWQKTWLPRQKAWLPTQKAKGMATKAKGMATTAKCTATKAKGMATMAKHMAIKAKGTANKAKGMATKAKHMAIKAKGTANKAKGMATTAHGNRHDYHGRRHSYHGKRYGYHRCLAMHVAHHVNKLNTLAASACFWHMWPTGVRHSDIMTSHWATTAKATRHGHTTHPTCNGPKHFQILLHNHTWWWSLLYSATAVPWETTAILARSVYTMQPMHHVTSCKATT